MVAQTSADVTANVKNYCQLCTLPNSIQRKITSDLTGPDPPITVSLTMIYFLDC